MRKITRELRVELKPDELRSRGARQAQLVEELAELEEMKRDSAKAFGEQAKDLRAELLKLSRVVRSGCEFREVACQELVDYRENCVRIIREDTQETIETRAMTDEDRQRHLDDYEDPAPVDAADDGGEAPASN